MGLMRSLMHERIDSDLVVKELVSCWPRAIAVRYFSDVHVALTPITVDNATAFVPLRCCLQENPCVKPKAAHVTSSPLILFWPCLRLKSVNWFPF